MHAVGFFDFGTDRFFLERKFTTMALYVLKDGAPVCWFNSFFNSSIDYFEKKFARKKANAHLIAFIALVCEAAPPKDALMRLGGFCDFEPERLQKKRSVFARFEAFVCDGAPPRMLSRTFVDLTWVLCNSRFDGMKRICFQRFFDKIGFIF